MSDDDADVPSKNQERGSEALGKEDGVTGDKDDPGAAEKGGAEEKEAQSEHGEHGAPPPVDPEEVAKLAARAFEKMEEEAGGRCMPYIPISCLPN